MNDNASFVEYMKAIARQPAFWFAVGFAVVAMVMQWRG